MGLLIYKYEPFWQEVSVKSLILRWPLRPVGLLLYLHPSIQKVLIYKESSENALNVCSYENWIGGWGVCDIWKNNIIILLISTLKLYFGDDDAIIHEPVWKWGHNYRHKISRDPFVDFLHFWTYSAISVFRQIDRSNFAVRGISSLLK